MPIDPGRIFAALVEMTQNTNNLSYENAIQAAKARFPELWDLVEAITRQKV